VVLVAALLPGGAPVVAQQAPDPSDEFFDSTSVRDIRITMSDRDWSLLHDKYLENTKQSAGAATPSKKH
jgi:hypothetical protein